MTYYIRDIYIYQIDFIVVGMGPLLKLGQIRQRETGDSSCFCIFLVALLIRASADLAIVGDNFGSLLVIPMDENSWLPPCQFPAIHQIKIIVFLRFYDVEHAAAHDMMAYFSHMIARPVRRHWEGVVTFQLPDRTNWNDATVPDFACEGLPRRQWCLPGLCMVPGTVRFKVFAPSRSQSMREASAIARRVPWDRDHPSVIHEEDLYTSTCPQEKGFCDRLKVDWGPTKWPFKILLRGEWTWMKSLAIGE